MTHSHLLVQGLGRTAIGAADAAEFLRSIIVTIGMRIADIPGNPLVYDCSVAGDEGITVAAIIETSHCVLHTWINQRGLTLYEFDLYSCAPFDPVRIGDLLRQKLDLVSCETMLIDRADGIRIEARS